jgi:hypothetical protein
MMPFNKISFTRQWVVLKYWVGDNDHDYVCMHLRVWTARVDCSLGYACLVVPRDEDKS